MRTGTTCRRSRLGLEDLEYRRLLTASVGDDDYVDLPGPDACLIGTQQAQLGSVAGSIETANDRDVFRLQATAGENLRFEITEGDAATKLTMLDSVGDVLVQHVKDSGDAMSWIAPYSGEIYFSVSSPGVTDNSYLVSVQRNDHPNRASLAKLSEVGRTQQGTLESLEGVDWFRYQVEPGKAYLVAATAESNFESVALTVRYPDYTLIGQDADGYHGRITFVATQPEIWVAVSTPERIFTNYQLNVLAYDTTALVAEPQPGDDALSLGVPNSILPQTQRGVITEPGGVQTHRFRAVAGSHFYRFETELGSLSNTSLKLRAADSSDVIAHDDDGGDGLASRLYWRAPADGIYELDITGLQDRGSYTITAAVIPDDWADKRGETAGSFTNNRVSGVLSHGGDVDVFRLDVEPAETYWLTMEGGSIDQSVVAQVVTADGTPLLSQLSSSPSVWTTEDAGPYYLQVATSGWRANPYVLYFEQQTDDHPNDISPDVISIAAQAVTGRLESPADRDIFALQPSPGTLFRFISLPSSSFTNVELLDQAGNVIPWLADRSWKDDGETKYARVSSDHEFGNYEFQILAVDDDHGGLDNPTPITVGEAVDGRLEVLADEDAFVLETTAGLGYAIRQPSSRVRVIDPQGNVVYHNFSDYAFKSAGGSYTILFDQGRPSYQFAVEEVADDYPDSPSGELLLLESAASVDGKLEVHDDVDYFVFDAVAHDDVEFSFAPFSRFEFRVLSLDAQTEYLHGLGGIELWEAPETGRYLVEIRSEQYSGDYSLRVTTEDDFPDNPEDTAALPLQSGVTQAGNIEIAGDRDVFTIDLVEGDDLQIDVRMPGQAPQITLWSGATQIEATSSSQLNWKSDRTGSIDVTIENAFARAAEYELTAIFVDDHPDSVAGALETITLGQPQVGRLEVIDDIDAFQFQVAAQQIVEFRIAGIDTILPLQLRLIGQDGTTELFRSTQESVLWKAPQAGTFYLDIQTPQTDVGNYQLELLPQSFDDDHADFISDGLSRLENDVPLLARHEVWNDRDLFTFEATAEESFRFYAEQVTHSHEPELSIFNAEGELILGPAQRHLFWKAENPGTYFLQVASSRGSGSYEVTKASTIDDFADRRQDASIIEQNLETISGVMNLRSDVDVWRFDARQNEVFTAAVSTDRFVLTLQILDGEGKVRASGQQRVHWRASEAGTYYLEISQPSEDLSEYSLQLTSVQDAHADTLTGATPIAPGEPIVSGLEIDDDRDVFVLPTVAGLVYHVEFEQNVVVQRLVDGRWDSNLHWKANATGPQHIRVSQDRSANDYTLRVREAADDFPDVPGEGLVSLNVGQGIAGELDYTNDSDVFVVTAEIGQVFDLTLGAQVAVEVLSSEAEVLGACNGCESFSWKTREPVQYVRVVGSLQSYELSLHLLEVIDDYPDFPSDRSHVLARDQSQMGRTDVPWEWDVFGFDTLEGELFKFTATSNQGAAPRVYLLDADANVLDSYETNTWQWKAPRALRYYAAVVMPVTGDYALTHSLLNVDDVADRVVEKTPAIEPGRDYSGVFEVPADRDVYAFDVEANQAVQIVAERSLFRRTNVSILDRDGTTPLTSSHANRVTATLTEPGRYFVAVDNTDVVGDYDLRFEVSNDDHADFPTPTLETLSLNAPATGRLDVGNDRDLFQFEAVAGVAYQVDIDRDSFASNSTLAILTGAGEVLIENFGSRLTWTASESGWHIVSITGSRAVGYSVTLTETDALVPGDLNGDQRFDHQDIDALFAAIRSSSQDLEFDINHDGIVNDADIVALLAERSVKRGDADLDGRVGFKDFLLLSASFGKAGGWQAGNFDGDVEVDFADFLTLSSRFGE